MRSIAAEDETYAIASSQVHSLHIEDDTAPSEMEKNIAQPLTMRKLWACYVLLTTSMEDCCESSGSVTSVECLRIAYSDSYLCAGWMRQG